MALDANTDSGPLTRGSRALGRYVNHGNPLVRFVSLWLICATLFVAAWYVGYHLLPADCSGRRTPRARSPSTPAPCGRSS